MAAEYTELSNTEESFDSLSGEVFNLWGTEANFIKAQLGAVFAPVLVMHGRYEEVIMLEHSNSLAKCRWF